MNYLLDEQLHESAARSLDALGRPEGDAFTYILDHRDPGTEDDEIPALCSEIGAAALITANVRDFGARKRYYEALLAAGVHVVVLRPGKIALLPGRQVALIANHYATIRKHLQETNSPQMLRVTYGEVRAIDLADLMAETEESDRNP